MKNIYELLNNYQNDIFRYARKIVGYAILFCLGYLCCYYFNGEQKPISCNNYYITSCPSAALQDKLIKLPDTGIR